MRSNVRLKKAVHVLILLAVSPAVLADPLTGALQGSVSGTVQDDNGAMVAPQAAVQATIFANDNNGNITATIEGSAACTGGLGLAISFTAQYDAATQGFTGMYSDTPGKAPDTPISFTNTGGLAWTAAVSGNAPSATGERAYDLEMAFIVDQEAIFPGPKLPADKRFGGQLNQTQVVQVPVSIPALQLDETLSVEVVFQGSWNAVAVPNKDGSSTFTGEASGSFSSPQASVLNVNTPNGPMSIPVSVGGSFGGTLFYLSESEVAFQGAWVADGGGQAFGGDISVNIPLSDISSFPFSIDGVMEISTGVEQMPSVSIPFSSSGAFPLDLTPQS
jgi:hypothetical protein